MLLFLGSVLPYIAVAVATIGLAWRTVGWLRRPSPYRLALSPQDGSAASIAGELLWFRSLYRGRRGLWAAAWLMHASLALILVGHLVGIGLVGEQFTFLGVSAATSRFWSAALGTVAGVALAAALASLLVRRALIAEVRGLSSPVDYFEPALLLAITVTGLAMRFGPETLDLATVRAYLASLLRFRPEAIPQNGVFLVHFTLVNLLLLWLPFSKLVHVTGALVGRTLLVPGPGGESRVVARTAKSS